MPIRGNIFTGTVACFDEPNQIGDIFDINAPRNAPAKDPAANLTALSWHSDLFQYEVDTEFSVTINHSALGVTTYRIGSAGGGLPGGTPPAVYLDVYGDVRVTDINLGAHTAGASPIFMVALDGRMLPSGHLIQQDTTDTGRFVAPWVSASNVFLRETAMSGTNALAGTSRTYRVMVFRTRAKDPSKPLLAGDESGLQLARGIIDSSRKYAKQVAVGESPYAINLGPTIDCANGGVRTATGGLTFSEALYAGAMAAPAYRNIGL